MKAISVAILVFAAVAQSAFALSYSDILGTWRGVRVESGLGYSLREPTVAHVTAFLGGGLTLKSSIRVPGYGVLTGTSYLYPNGRIQGFAKYKGVTISIVRGTWWTNGQSLVQRVRVTALNGGYSAISTMIVTGNTMVYDTRASKGVNISGTLRRR